METNSLNICIGFPRGLSLVVAGTIVVFSKIRHFRAGVVHHLWMSCRRSFV